MFPNFVPYYITQEETNERASCIQHYKNKSQIQWRYGTILNFNEPNNEIKINIEYHKECRHFKGRTHQGSWCY